MPLQRRKLNKQAMLSVTRWPSSSSRSCLSRTIDCTTDILDLNGGRKKEALNDCLCWACEGPTEGWIAKRETNDFLKQHLCLKINPSDIDGGAALWKGEVWKWVCFLEAEGRFLIRWGMEKSSSHLESPGWWYGNTHVSFELQFGLHQLLREVQLDWVHRLRADFVTSWKRLQDRIHKDFSHHAESRLLHLIIFTGHRNRATYHFLSFLQVINTLLFLNRASRWDDSSKTKEKALALSGSPENICCSIWSGEQIKIWFAIRHFNSQQTEAAFWKTH